LILVRSSTRIVSFDAPTQTHEPGFESFGAPSAKARIWFGLHVTDGADAPGTAESGSVWCSEPDSRRRKQSLVASRDLREPDSSVPVAQRKA
jgi:hypothetical protein